MNGPAPKPLSPTPTVKQRRAHTDGAAAPASSGTRLGRQATEADERKSPWRAWWTKWEVPRKVLHSSIGCFAVYGWLVDTDVPSLVFKLSGALCIIVTADVLRFRSRWFARLYESLLGFLMRPSERTAWNGVIFYLLGVIIVLVTLPRDLAVLSIMILSWCDTAASTAGRLFGRYTPALPSPFFASRKSVAGFLGAFGTGMVASYGFWQYLAPLNPAAVDASWTAVHSNYLRGPETVGEAVARVVGHNTLAWLGRAQLPSPRSTIGLGGLAATCGLVAALAEAVDVWSLDDNLTLPVLSGYGIWFILWVVG